MKHMGGGEPNDTHKFCFNNNSNIYKISIKIQKYTSSGIAFAFHSSPSHGSMLEKDGWILQW